MDIMTLLKSSKKRKSDALDYGSGPSTKNSTPSAESKKANNPILKKIKISDDSTKKKKSKKTEEKKEASVKIKIQKSEGGRESGAKRKKSSEPKKNKGSFGKKSKGWKGSKSIMSQMTEEQKKEFTQIKEVKADEAIAGLPFWLLPQFRQDKNGRKMNEMGYDPTTLYIPQNEYYKLPSMDRKYWKFKSKYFDKMVAVKMWNFYFFYGSDAIAIHKLFDTKLNEQKGRVYTQFPDVMLNKYAPKLLENGHKIVVVEKVKKNQKKDDDRTKKGICQVITRGTFADNVDLGYYSQFCLCIFEHNLKFGLVYFDVTTHEFYIGEFQDDIYRASLRTLITKIKPVEIVYIPEFLHKESLAMLRALSTQPMLSPLSFKDGKIPSLSEIIKRLLKYFGMRQGNKPVLPKLLADMKEALQSKIRDTGNSSMEDNSQGEACDIRKEAAYPFFYALQGLLLCMTHLENVMLADIIFTMGSFSEINIELEKKLTLYLDSQALENLEILEIGYLNNQTSDNSLFGYMDKTVSPFGKRMFRRWVVSPLFDPVGINQRLDAVEELVKHYDLVDYYQEQIKTLPDLERIINKTYCLTNKKKAPISHFEELAKSRMGDFIKLLSELEKVEPIIEKMGNNFSESRSKRLKQLTKVKDVDIKAFEQKQNYNIYSSKGDGLFPKVSHIISDLKAMVQNRNGLLLPAPGIQEECDNIIAQIDSIKEQLQEILNDLKAIIGDESLKYVHTKQRYEVECPENSFEKFEKPREFVITSKKKGFIRFQTPIIEKGVKEIDNLESQLTKSLIVFVVDYFKKFYERRAYWNQVVLCLAELDCLCGLARLAVEMKVKCRPQVLPSGQKPHFELKDMVHPCVASQNKNFVANDMVVEDNKNIFLITGPNMGGKSTFLRQACIAVIMAQIGSFVPATYFKFNVIDRIFTRIGASDRLVEGKSTFFIEMEETYHIITEATKDSFLVVDELGRGTSTYDGVSIAYAALKFIAQKLKCLTLFATHYHLLVEEFKLYKNVDTYCMASDFDAENDELKFKYKFVKGHETTSHGLMIAKMAGLPKLVLQRAKVKAATMTKEKLSVNLEGKLTHKFNNMIEKLEDVESLRPLQVNYLINELENISKQSTY